MRDFHVAVGQVETGGSDFSPFSYSEFRSLRRGGSTMSGFGVQRSYDLARGAVSLRFADAPVSRLNAALTPSFVAGNCF